jgi:hypothetical protein
VSYAPAASNDDGRFRTIEIRSMRPGIEIQSRKGYFAMPLLNGEPLAPFELAALTALNHNPAPRAFEFHAQMLRFGSGGDETECRAVFSVPSGALTFADDPKSKRFHMHVSFVGLVKDESGQVIAKVSRDLPFQAPADKRAEFERGETTATLPFRARPGRYRLEAAAVDDEGQKASVRKISFFVPGPARLGLSDVVVVRSVERAAGERDAWNPLEFQGGAVTPEVNATVAKSAGAVGRLYFVLFPDRMSSAKPTVTITVSHNGKTDVEAGQVLPEADADGSIRVLSQIGLGGLESGAYEVTVKAVQGTLVATGSAVVNLAP